MTEMQATFPLCSLVGGAAVCANLDCFLSACVSLATCDALAVPLACPSSDRWLETMLSVLRDPEIDIDESVERSYVRHHTSMTLKMVASKGNIPVDNTSIRRKED